MDTCSGLLFHRRCWLFASIHHMVMDEVSNWEGLGHVGLQGVLAETGLF